VAKSKSNASTPHTATTGAIDGPRVLRVIAAATQGRSVGVVARETKAVGYDASLSRAARSKK
jgi:hypothetical protein